MELCRAPFFRRVAAPSPCSRRFRDRARDLRREPHILLSSAQQVLVVPRTTGSGAPETTENCPWSGEANPARWIAAGPVPGERARLIHTPLLRGLVVVGGGLVADREELERAMAALDGPEGLEGSRGVWIDSPEGLRC